MLTRHSLAFVASLIALAGTAQAEVLASGPVYGGNPSGGTAICRIFNAGLTNVSIPSRAIITNTDVSLTLTGDTCNVPIGPSKNCVFLAAIPGNLAISCRLAAAGIDVRLRGRAEVQSSGGAVLVGQPID